MVTKVDLYGSNYKDLIDMYFASSIGTNALSNSFKGLLNLMTTHHQKPVYNTAGQGIRIVYSGTTQGWIPTSDDDVNLKTPQTYTCDFLVIARGGGEFYFWTRRWRCWRI